jgi:hypothetical protein
LYALLSGSPPRNVAAVQVTAEQLVEAANKPIAPIPGVNKSLMDVLMEALSNDPTARPTAAKFFGQLAKVPLRTPRRGPLVRPAEDTSFGSRRRRSVVSGHSAVSNSHGVAVTPVAPDSERAPGRAPAAETPRQRGKRRAGILVLTAALVTVIVSTTAWLISKPASSGAPPGITQSATAGGMPSGAGPSRDSDAGPSNSTTTPGAGDNTGSGPAGEKTIRLEKSADSAKPFQTVRIQGTYRGEADTFLRVQRLEGGKWLAFPLPTKTDQSGRFTAHVEFDQPGRYRLRVLDPASGVKSKPFELVIKD